MTQRLTTKLVKELHRSKVREALEADECASEAEALLQLRALQLDHQGLEAIDGLEPFDRCEELYLDHNSIRIIQVFTPPRDSAKELASWGRTTDASQV